MRQYLLKDDVIAEIEKLISNGKLKCQQAQENNDQVSHIAWSEHIATCGKILSILNTLKVKEVNEECIQYDSIKAGIQTSAETYSFNIESQLYNQLVTKEQQKLWRKEIEQAYIIGGEESVELAKDPRYKENKVQEEPVSKDLDFLKEKAKEAFCKARCDGHPPRSTCTSLGTCKEHDNFVKILRREQWSNI